MAIFEYSAIDAQGKSIRGSISGGSLSVAQQELIRRGLRVTALNPIAGVSANDPNIAPPVGNSTTNDRPQSAQQTRPQANPDPSIFTANLIPPIQQKIKSKVNLKHLREFFIQTGTLLNAGVLPYESFETLGRNFPDDRMKQICTDLSKSSYAGDSFVSAMEKYPEAFSPLMIATMKAGEKGGFLVHSCRENARYIEEEMELRRMMRKATLYPKIQLVLALLIIAAANFIAMAIVGKNIFNSPLNNPVVLLFLGIFGAAIFWFLNYATRNPVVRVRFDRFILTIPVIGTTVAQYCVAKFGRALGMLYRGGMSPVEGLKIAADACGNQYLRAKIYQGSPVLERGDTLSEALQATGVFTDTVMTMVRTGEKSGEVDQMLMHLAEYYEKEAEHRSHAVATISGFAIGLFVMGYIVWMIIQAGSPVVGMYREAATY